jgi:putative membrane protein
MKTTLLSLALTALLFTTVGCGGGKTDSTETAEKINETKIDNQAPPVAGETGDKDRQEDVAGFMVDLANTGATEFALSQLAATRATDAAVRAYAANAVAEHRDGEVALKSMATAKNITLPTDLSDESREAVTKLTGEKAGRDFDKRYLDTMVDVNDKALTKVKKLADVTEDQSLKTYLAKLIADDESHRDEARKLSDNLK